MRGHRLEDLAAGEGYEGAIAILWDRFVGDNLTAAGIGHDLAVGRQRAFEQLDAWCDAAAKRPLAEGLRIALATLPDDGPPAMIAGAFPAMIAALLRRARGEPAVPPDPALGTAADLLRMMAGEPARPEAAAALDTYFVALIDNGLSASSFAARIIASTRASLAAAVVAPTAPSRARCTAARPGWCRQCSTRSPQAPTSTPGSPASSMPASG